MGIKAFTKGTGTPQGTAQPTKMTGAKGPQAARLGATVAGKAMTMSKGTQKIAAGPVKPTAKAK